VTDGGIFHVVIGEDHADLRIIAPPDAPPLTGSEALELGKKLLERGAIAVALEAVDRPRAKEARASR
jgi:hypothetical protein